MDTDTPEWLHVLSQLKSSPKLTWMAEYNTSCIKKMKEIIGSNLAEFVDQIGLEDFIQDDCLNFKECNILLFEAIFWKLVESNSEISKVKIEEMEVPDIEWWNRVSSLKIKSVSIVNSSINLNTFNVFMKQDLIENISLIQSQMITELHCVCFNALRTLEVVKVTDMTRITLVNCPSLESVSIKDCGSLSVYISNCKSISTFEIQNTNLNVLLLSDLQNISNITIKGEELSKKNSNINFFSSLSIKLY